MSGRRQALVAALAFLLSASTLDAAAAMPLAAPRLVVLVNDYAGAAPAVLARAQSHVTFIYRVAGVDILWIERDDPRLQDAEFLKSMVTVTLYSEEMENRPPIRNRSWARRRPAAAR